VYVRERETKVFHCSDDETMILLRVLTRRGVSVMWRMGMNKRNK
jgi:hypothetical protein